MTRPGALGSQGGWLAIAIVGQLDLVTLIGLIPGRFQQGLRR